MSILERGRKGTTAYGDVEEIREQKLRTLIGVKQHVLRRVAEEQQAWVVQKKHLGSTVNVYSALDVPLLVDGLKAAEGRWPQVNTQEATFTLPFSNKEVVYHHPKIIQPDIVKPDTKTDLGRSQLSITKAAWLRAVAPQLEMNTDWLVAAHVMTKIIGDDENMIMYGNTLRKNPLHKDEALLRESQEALMVRLAWESSDPATPEDIRPQIYDVLDHMSTVDWANDAHYDQSSARWLAMREHVENYASSHKGAMLAMKYGQSRNKVLRRYWNEFLQGTGQK